MIALKKALRTGILTAALAAACMTIAPNTRAQGKFAITAFPAIIDQSVEPNQQTRLLLQFKNNSDSIVTGKVKISNYTVNNKSGDPIVIEDPSVKVKYAAADWISVDQEDIAIPPNNYVAVNLNVNTPAEIATCGNYAIAFFEYDQSVQPGMAANTQSASSLTAKVGALINLTAKNQQCTEKLSVARFETPSFLEFGPVPVSFDILNMGDVHEAPMGKIVLKDMFNSVVATEKIKDQRIFPEAAKTYTNKLGQQWLIGRFAVELQATYGKTNTPLVYTAYMWIIPWRLIIIILLAIIILAVIIKNMLGKLEHKEKELESKLEKEEAEISQLKKMLREKKE